MARGLVAVTGATGFLGRHLVRELAADGWRVKILARRDIIHPLWRDLEIEVVLGDLANEDALDRLCRVMKRTDIALFRIIGHTDAVGADDYNRKLSPRTCLRNVTKYLAPGAIVVFHDSEKAFRNMRYALPRTLEKIRQMGLKCKAIEL